jgi:hypothetical protein
MFVKDKNTWWESSDTVHTLGFLCENKRGKKLIGTAKLNVYQKVLRRIKGKQVLEPI